jgi:hypothetical protein
LLRMIRFVSLILALVVCCAAGAFGDDRFQLSGYYKNLLYDSESLAGNGYTGDLNRLRLDAEYRPSHDVTGKIVLDTEAVIGSVLDTGEFKAVKGSRPAYSTLEWTFADNSDVWGRTSVHRLYLEAKSGNITGTVGRQRIAWGSGRLWNPTDVFNPVSPFEIERDERAGTDAASVTLYPGPLSSITTVYAPEREGKDDVALRARTNMQGYDVSLVLASLNNRDLLGLDFAGNIGDSSFRGEVTHEALTTADALFPERRERFARSVLSWDYTFASTLYVLVEYLYNGGNVRRDVPLTFIAGEIVTRNRNFIAFGLGYDLTPLIRTECTVVRDVDGNGVVAEPSLNYNVRQNVDWVTGGLLIAAKGEYEGQHSLYYTSVKVFF